MEGIIFIIIVFVLFGVMQGGKKKKKPVQPGQTQAQVQMNNHYSAAVPTKMPPRTTPMPAATAAVPAMAAAPMAGSIGGFSTEGMELHDADFHKAPIAPSQEGQEGHGPGFHSTRLEKVDLGQLRAQENAHTAANLLWKPPEESTVYASKSTNAQPMFTAEQLRQAIITKEILDAPVSRRQGVRRTYGR